MGSPVQLALFPFRAFTYVTSFLSPQGVVAPAGYSRWLVPPAAMAVHLCIGEVYGFSVFNEPLTKVIGVTAPVAGRDWTIPQVGWIYSIALAMLGLSAAFLGKWVERRGPRVTMLASLACFCGGLLVSALGVRWHQLWMLYLGYGVIGGIGLGLGYIAPVSTLMKWFPDRPGLATGLAIMGFGGGALVGAPLGQELMKRYATSGSTGVAATFVTLAGIYSVFMLFGALLVRVPGPGWKSGGDKPAGAGTGSGTGATAAAAGTAPTKALAVGVDRAWRTPQFWCLWLVLALNVTAGIGILGQASLMCQDMFGVPAAVGAGFTGLLSIFNMGGRFVWSTASDRTGRKAIYAVYFLLGAVLYALLPWTQATQRRLLFVAVTAVIISMYGGGFATIPAYLRDIFGSHQIGAIHGRLITAWSLAALLGPQLVNYLSDARKKAGVARAEAYTPTFYVMAGLLVVGCVFNLMVKPVDPRHHLPEGGGR